MKSVEDVPAIILTEMDQHSVFLITVDNEGTIQLACAFPENPTDKEKEILAILRKTFFENESPLIIKEYNIPGNDISILKPANKIKV